MVNITLSFRTLEDAIQFAHSIATNPLSRLVVGSATQPVQPVATQPIPQQPSLMDQIRQVSTALIAAGKQDQVGAVLQNEFGISSLSACPPAVQANLLARLQQL